MTGLYREALELARLLVRKISGIRESRMRREVVVAELLGYSPLMIAATLEKVFSASGDLYQAMGLLREAVTDALVLTGQEGTELPYELKMECYRLAREHNLQEAARLLLAPPPQRSLADEEPVKLHISLAELTLGHRRALARRSSREALDHLLADADPVVIRNLLNNARTVERDVVKLAAHRPVAEATLLEIYRHRRWSQRYNIKFALVMNPYTAPAIALKLVSSLILQDLREVVGATHLHDEVRQAARDQLAYRRRAASEQDGEAE